MFEELSIDGNQMVNEYYLDTSDRYVDVGQNLSGYRPDEYSLISGDQKPNKASKVRARFITGDSYIRDLAQHCNFAGDECWNVRTHAVIDSISADSGSVDGGQELTIKGWGLA